MKTLCAALLLASAWMAAAHAGDVNVTWQEPDKYTDIRPSSETRDAFRDRVIKELGLVFTDLATKLPDGVVWTVTVTDVDLAGDVRPAMHAGVNDIRVVKDVYWPRISLSYRMTDAKGQLISEGKEDIKDMGFLSVARVSSRHTSFEYEEKMLQDWFKKQQRDKKFPAR